jgi:hypothetical protein
VAEVTAYADAAVVGSALVALIAEHGGSRDLPDRVEAYVRWLRGAGACGPREESRSAGAEARATLRRSSGLS